MRSAKVFLLLFVVFPSHYKVAQAVQPKAGSERIAFVGSLKGNWDIFLIDQSGRNLFQLTDTPYDENEPRWSADREKIVYSASDGKLHVIDVETGQSHQVPVEDDGGKKTSPSFSPDGKKIVYVHFKPEKADDTELAIFDLDRNIKVSTSTLSSFSLPE